jgi:hypothetical protein
LFFYSCFELCHLRVFEGSGVHDPWGPREPLSGSWIKHEQKKEKKVLKKFFVFCFFIRVLIYDTWGCSRDQGFMTPWGPWDPEWFINIRLYDNREISELRSTRARRTIEPPVKTCSRFWISCVFFSQTFSIEVKESPFMKWYQTNSLDIESVDLQIIHFK